MEFFLTMIDRINQLAANRIPFLFIIDYDLENPHIIPLDQISRHQINYCLPLHQYTSIKTGLPQKIRFEKFPIAFRDYERAFQICRRHFQLGHSYLLNLTFPTLIKTNLSLEQIFHYSRAKYKLLFKDQFVVFSPETFITIKGHTIACFPMKGTIDALVPDARHVILNDEKEFAEHITIVDLIRNDIGMVATDVKVRRFRFIDEIKTNQKNLLQVSSEITGRLEPDFHKRLGEIIYRLLPAGSITGAPKKKTVFIIKEAENYQRQYYTGIFGIFDGYQLDSAVMIRFIEKKGGQLWFKSGGGLTIYSDVQSEYEEYQDKIYVPITGNH